MNEEFERRFERKMEFLLNQQVKFDAEMVELKQVQAEMGKKLDRTIDMVSSLASLTFEGFKVTDAKIKAVADAQKALTESQKLTDEKLRDLTALMDRHTREGHHGTAT